MLLDPYRWRPSVTRLRCPRSPGHRRQGSVCANWCSSSMSSGRCCAGSIRTGCACAWSRTPPAWSPPRPAPYSNGRRACAWPWRCWATPSQPSPTLASAPGRPSWRTSGFASSSPSESCLPICEQLLTNLNNKTTFVVYGAITSTLNLLYIIEWIAQRTDYAATFLSTLFSFVIYLLILFVRPGQYSFMMSYSMIP